MHILCLIEVETWAHSSLTLWRLAIMRPILRLPVQARNGCGGGALSAASSEIANSRLPVSFDGGGDVASMLTMRTPLSLRELGDCAVLNARCNLFGGVCAWQTRGAANEHIRTSGTDLSLALNVRPEVEVEAERVEVTHGSAKAKTCEVDSTTCALSEQDYEPILRCLVGPLAVPLLRIPKLQPWRDDRAKQIGRIVGTIYEIDPVLGTVSFPALLAHVEHF